MAGQIDQLDREIAELKRDICQRLAPHEPIVGRLAAIPDFGEVSTRMAPAELGLDTEVFRTPQRAAGWCVLCPGNRKSAGKRGPTKARIATAHRYRP